jgi:hypothetical protein
MAPIVSVLAVAALGLALAPALADEARDGHAGGPSGTLLFLSQGNRLTSIDVASGRTTVRRVPGVASCNPDLRVTGGRAIFAGVRKQRTVVFSVPVTLERGPKLLGTAHAFAVSRTEGRVWLAGVDCDRSKMVGVREVTVDGRVTMRNHRRVPGSWVAGAVDQGLVLQRGRAAIVWDPRTGHRRAALGLGAVIDAQGSLVAGCRTPRCRELTVLDVRSGRTTTPRPRAPFRLDFGTRFSPDGSLLAAPAVVKRRWRVAMINALDGTTTVVPGSSTGEAYPDLRWSPSTGWLFFRSHGNRLMAYRPGESRAVKLPFRWPRKAIAFVAG